MTSDDRWMEKVRGADGKRGRIEGKLRDLRGRRLTSVDYWNVHTFGPERAPWDYGDWHHAVMGVQLGTDLGSVTVTSTNAVYPYGVEVFHDPIGQHLVLGESAPERVGPGVEGNSPWAPLLGSRVHSTACHWEQLQIGPSRRADGSIAAPAHSVDVPVALRLDFAAGSIWIVAAIPQLPDPQRVVIPGDEIMVVFSARKMRDMGFDDPAFIGPSA